MSSEVLYVNLQLDAETYKQFLAHLTFPGDFPYHEDTARLLAVIATLVGLQPDGLYAPDEWITPLLTIKELFEQRTLESAYRRDFDSSDLQRAAKASVLGITGSGLLLLEENRLNVIETGWSRSNEFELFSRARGVQNVLSLQVQKPHCYHTKYGRAYFFEPINGSTLDQKLLEGPIPARGALLLVQDILSALQGLRQVGICAHRDIRPANILIDESGTAHIASLGYALEDASIEETEFKRLVAPRGYSGIIPNDKTNLGQLLYLMITGEQLFPNSRTMSTTTLFSRLADERNEAYAQNGLAPYLHKVDHSIADALCRETINALLTNNDPPTADRWNHE